MKPTMSGARRQAAEAIRRLSEPTLPVPLLLQNVSPHVAAAVPHDAWAWQVYDPVAMLPIEVVSSHEVPMGIRMAHCEIEQSGEEPDAFRLLTRSRCLVTTLDRATGGRLGVSRRYRELLAPAGTRHELRAALVRQGHCWGTLALSRQTGPDFSGVELAWIQRISSMVAAALQRNLINVPPASEPTIEPAVLLVERGADPVALTQAGQQWLTVLAQEDGGTPVRWLAIHAAAVRARLQGPDDPVHLRQATPLGWISVHAARDLRSDQVIISLRSARTGDLLRTLTAAYGLSAKENSVVKHVLQGCSSREIAQHLRITTDTVHDHLQAIYLKTGTHTRGRLRHRLAIDTWTGADGTDQESRGTTGL